MIENKNVAKYWFRASSQEEKRTRLPLKVVEYLEFKKKINDQCRKFIETKGNILI